jgi:hypothetical protein
MNAVIRGAWFRLCPKCQMLIHVIKIEFDQNYVGSISIDMEGMCGHGHAYGFYVSSDYGIELDTAKIDWVEKK